LCYHCLTGNCQAMRFFFEQINWDGAGNVSHETRCRHYISGRSWPTATTSIERNPIQALFKIFDALLTPSSFAHFCDSVDYRPIATTWNTTLEEFQDVPMDRQSFPGWLGYFPGWFFPGKTFPGKSFPGWSFSPDRTFPGKTIPGWSLSRKHVSRVVIFPDETISYD